MISRTVTLIDYRNVSKRTTIRNFKHNLSTEYYHIILNNIDTSILVSSVKPVERTEMHTSVPPAIHALLAFQHNVSNVQLSRIECVLSVNSVNFN